MANRYWVGGTGTWNGTNTVNWSTSSGGVVGASVPTSADNVFFDANSNVGTTAFTVTMVTATAVCLDFDATAVDGVMTLAGTASMNIYGSFLLPATNFTRSNTGSITFAATATGKTINLNGKSFGSAVTFDGIGGGWTFSSAFSTGGTGLTLTNGSLNLGGFTATCFAFGSNNANARTLAFNGGLISIIGTANTANQTLWNVATATNLTVTGTPTVNVINTSTNSGFTRTFTHGGTAGGSEPNAVNLNIQAGDTGSLVSVQGAFKNLDFTGCSSTLSNSGRYIYGNLVMSSTMTLTAGANATSFAATNATQQITSAALNFDFPINFGYSFATSAASGDGTTATLTFSTSTNCPAVGSTIVVSGVTPTGYNGTYTVTASTNTSVSYLNATTGAQTVSGIIVNGGSTTYVLQDALTVATPSSATARTINLYTGTLNLNNFTLSNFGAFAITSNVSAVRAIAFGTGNITCTYNTAASNTVWNCPTLTNFSITGTPTVNVTGTSSGAFTRTVAHGNTSGGSETNAITVNVSAGSDTIGINGCFIDLNLTGFTGTLAGNTRFIYGNLIISSGTTVTASTLSTSFCRASGTQQITTNAKNLDFPINFGYNLTTTAATGNGTTATLTINSTLNCIAVGSTITVVNVTPAGYNGTYTVTASTNTTVSYLNATTGAQTVSGTLANAGSTTYTLQDALTVGSAGGRNVGLSSGTLNLNNFSFTIFGNFASSVTYARTLAFGTGNITITNTNVGQTIWNVGIATNLTVTGTPTVNVTGAVPSGTTRFINHGNTSNGTEANSVSFYISAGAEPFTIQGAIRNLDFTGYTAALNNSARTIYGNLTLSSGMSLVAGVSATTFGSTSATVRTITTNAQNLDFPITFNGVGGSWQLQDALTVGTSRAVNLNNGTFDSNAKSITCGTFNFNNTSTKTLTLTNSSITITGGTSTTGFVGSTTGTTYNFTGAEVIFTTTGTTLLAGTGSGATTSSLIITMSGTNGILIIGVSGQASIIGTLRNTVQPCTISLLSTAGALTVTNFNVSGTSGNLVTFNSSVAGTARTISKASGTVSASYLNLQDSTASGGATWNAYNSTNSGNNTGWNFLTLNSGNFLMFFN